MNDSFAGVGSHKRESQKLWLSLAAILLLSLPLFFFFLNGWSFFDPDEGRYGAIPRQMLQYNDFVTPTQNRAKFFDKPPLLYWTIATSYSLFGCQEWAARLIPALAALMACFAVYAMGHRMFGSRAGHMGAVILATSAMWPLLAHVVVTDMLVSSLICVTLAFWWLGHSEKPDPSDARDHSKLRQAGYFLGFWIALALGVLAKGPMAVVLTGGAIFSFLLICRQWKTLPKMQWIVGLPLFLVIAAPWFVLVAQRNPEFNHFFWYDQHIGRFLGHTTGNDHRQPVYYYFIFLPFLIFPWTFYLPAAVIAAVRNLRDTQNPKQQAAIYLLCGTGFITLFFSASSGKMLTYVLPTLPLLALLLGAYFEWLYRRRKSWNRLLSGGVVALAPLLAMAGVAVVTKAPAKLVHIGVAANTALLLGCLLIVWSVALAAATWRFGLKGLTASTSLGFTLVFAAAMPVVATVAEQYTTKSLVAYIRPGLTPKAEVLTINHIQSIEFYAGRRVEIMGTPDEMALGVAHMPKAEREAWIHSSFETIEHVQEEMGDPHPVYVFVRMRGHQQTEIDKLMAKIGPGAYPIKANERYLVFGNLAATVITPPAAANLLHISVR